MRKMVKEIGKERLISISSSIDKQNYFQKVIMLGLKSEKEGINCQSKLQKNSKSIRL